LPYLEWSYRLIFFSMVGSASVVGALRRDKSGDCALILLRLLAAVFLFHCGALLALVGPAIARSKQGNRQRQSARGLVKNVYSKSTRE
jgi:hypothetical protein